MKYGEIPGVNKPVSRIVQGADCINLEDREFAFELLDNAFATGVNTFDTAWVYQAGNSERVLGEWIRERGLRDEVAILTKGCHQNADRKKVTRFDLLADLHDSLARLGVEHIDIYVLHRDNPATPVGEIVDVLNELHEAGRVGAFGGSNWRHERIQEANEYAAENGLVPFTVSSPNYGLADQVENPWGEGCVTLSGPAQAEARVWHEANQLPVLAYSSLGRGLFSGRMMRDNYEELADNACQTAYCHEVNFQRLDRARELSAEKGVSIPQLALAYVLNRPLNTFPLVGARTLEECQANAAVLELELTPAELDYLDLQGEKP